LCAIVHSLSPFWAFAATTAMIPCVGNFHLVNCVYIFGLMQASRVSYNRFRATLFTKFTALNNVTSYTLEPIITMQVDSRGLKIFERFPAVGQPTKARLYFADTEQDLATSVPSSSTRMPDSSLITALNIFYGCYHSKLVLPYARCSLLLRKQTLCCRPKSVKSDAVRWRLRHKHVQKENFCRMFLPLAVAWLFHLPHQTWQGAKTVGLRRKLLKKVV
jgi:hypothetical protein